MSDSQIPHLKENTELNVDAAHDFSDELDARVYTRQARPTAQVRLLVLHSTDGGDSEVNAPNQPVSVAKNNTLREARYLSFGSAPKPDGDGRTVSIHWLIGAENAGAEIYKIVPEEFVAYHAGGTDVDPADWTDFDTGKTYSGYDVNTVSIGIEVVGTSYEKTIGPKQQASIRRLVSDIAGRYPILKQSGHIFSHAALRCGNPDGTNWIKYALEAVNLISESIVVPYHVKMSGLVIVRSGPGVYYNEVGKVLLDGTTDFTVVAEAHTDHIFDTKRNRFDDVWMEFNDIKGLSGYVTRTAASHLPGE